MIRRPPRSTQSRSSAASDVYKRQPLPSTSPLILSGKSAAPQAHTLNVTLRLHDTTSVKYVLTLSLIHISEPTRRTPISYAVFCLKKKKNATRRYRNDRGIT